MLCILHASYMLSCMYTYSTLFYLCIYSIIFWATLYLLASRRTIRLGFANLSRPKCLMGFDFLTLYMNLWTLHRLSNELGLRSFTRFYILGIALIGLGPRMWHSLFLCFLTLPSSTFLTPTFCDRNRYFTY